MEDAPPNVFVYARQPTVASLLWTAWLCVPKALRMAAYWALLRFGSDTDSTAVTQLPFDLYAKHKPRAWVREALVTQFVSQHTSIPVPIILDVLSDDRFGTLILMTRVPGRPLADMPESLDGLSEEQRFIFSLTMRGWFMQLRELAPPVGNAVCGFAGTSFFSYRLDVDEPVGPFESQDTFHTHYNCTLPPNCDPMIRDLAARIRAQGYRLCLTHGDISPTNILVDDNYVPVGLIDWQCAAWMPEYWELTATLWRRQRYPGGQWYKVFKQALPPYEEELAVETELWKTICPW